MSRNSMTKCRQGAGSGSLALEISGPSKARTTCEDNGDGTVTVTYVCDTVGEFVGAHAHSLPYPIPSPPPTRIARQASTRRT